ncbi:AraC family transcriptional regulator [Lentzea sp. NBC_00516]|uniref:AraC family transcriptional regulator n=1 Tax=Lentzea sp. NBC_00516 TaxID=2903582 RepID=UPI002E80E52C|nr:AraC family transcriptional regulator [Lentzea sp. NBC_00516]WUD29198.1 AraC family transcriptional regulator [Lentzea sp. NBC_00516]
MTNLSGLVRLARPAGEIDVRCLMAGGVTLDNPAAERGAVPFHLLLDGACTLTSGTCSVDLLPGDMALLPHGDAHVVTSDESIDLFCGHYRFDQAGSLLFRLMPPVVHVTLDPPALALAEVLRAEAVSAGAGSQAVISALLDALLVMTLRSRPDQRLDTPGLWTAMGDDVLGRVITGVLEQPGEPWTIDRLASEASMSRATFLRRFSARTGTTVATLLTAIRMMAAADLLSSTDLSVTRVAGEVGYRSESAFSQAFRAALGTSPARFRRESASR